jgi:hypothetical protein
MVVQEMIDSTVKIHKSYFAFFTLQDIPPRLASRCLVERDDKAFDWGLTILIDLIELD